MNVSCRVATVEDAGAIAAVHAESWRQTYRGILRDAYLDGDVERERYATWTTRLASPDDHQLVMVGVEGADGVEANPIRGFVCAYADADVGWGAFIDNLHVAEPCKGMGIGSALLRSAARWASTARPGMRPYLWVFEQNRRARRFYEGRGASRHEDVVRENPGGGVATYLRYAWEDPMQMLARCTRP